MLPMPSYTYLRQMEEAAKRTPPSRRHDREVEDLLLEAEFGRHVTGDTASPSPRGFRRLTLGLRALLSQTA